MNDDYLWSKSGEPDPEIERLETLLSPHRRRIRDRQFRRQPKVLPLLAAAAVLLLGVLGLYEFAPDSRIDPPRTQRIATSPYSLERLEGQVAVVDRDGRSIDGDLDSEMLPPGSKVLCQSNGRARVRVSGLGSVVLESGAQMRIDESDRQDDASGYLVHLEKGKLRASIFAAPRLFQVGTPSGIAVDLGCIYEATVRDDGSTLLAVDIGAVSFESAGRKVHVPAGAECIATPSRGPSTPFWSDDPEEFKKIVLSIDGAKEPSDSEIAILLSPRRPRASLTFFYLLDHASARVRHAVESRIAAIEPDFANMPREDLRRSLARNW